MTYKGKLPDLPWGNPVTGTLIYECSECTLVWNLPVKNYPIAEGMGEICPRCEKVTTNWVVDLIPLQSLSSLEMFF